jgi:hypothetical protein
MGIPVLLRGRAAGPPARVRDLVHRLGVREVLAVAHPQEVPQAADIVD